MTRRSVAVVGAGPSGLYAAAELLASGLEVDIDVFDRLAAPFGLVRYGVAPDHVKMKAVTRVLARPFTAGVRFLGNVRIGADGVPLAALERCYDAIIHATGSGVDRSLGIPGERLAGSIGSSAFVSWYSGHPDFVGLDPRPTHAVAVVGAGNVALDVARVLARTPEELANTDVPDPVLDVLRGGGVRDVHVLIRRGPQDVKFTTPELRQLGELTGVRVVVHDDGLLDEDPPAELDKRGRLNWDVFQAWKSVSAPGRSTRVHLRFLRSPVELRGDRERVSSIVVARNTVEDGRVRPTGERAELRVGLVVRAIGYTAEPIPGLPFDAATGTVTNTRGRVSPGHYVTGWLKRGPSGVIGTNKVDARETVQTLVEDLRAGVCPRASGTPDAVLAAHGVEPVDWSGWLRLDAEEVRRGADRSTDRVKVATYEEMLRAVRGA